MIFLCTWRNKLNKHRLYNYFFKHPNDKPSQESGSGLNAGFTLIKIYVLYAFVLPASFWQGKEG